MKRLTATLLAAAMCMGTFAGCGSNTEETTDNSNAGAAAGVHFRFQKGNGHG